MTLALIGAPEDTPTTLHRLEARGVAADLVESNPLADAGGAKGPVCARLVKELAGQLFAGP